MTFRTVEELVAYNEGFRNGQLRGLLIGILTGALSLTVYFVLWRALKMLF